MTRKRAKHEKLNRSKDELPGIDMGYCFFTQDGCSDELSVLVLKDYRK